MNAILTCSLLAAVAAVVAPASAQVQAEPTGNLAHTSEQFAFTVSAPYAEVFPLFGAHEERKWAKGFEPKFLHPVPAHDQPRMVFSTVQEGLPRVWMNTAFDSGTGHVQYVYWIAEVMTALIDIHVTNSGPSTTQVNVVYERTALRPEANDQVLHMAHADAHAGPHWAEMINGYFAQERASQR
jgi:hypothetical protein